MLPDVRFLSEQRAADRAGQVQRRSMAGVARSGMWRLSGSELRRDDDPVDSGEGVAHLDHAVGRHVVFGAASLGSGFPAEARRVAVSGHAGDEVQTDVRAAVVVGAADGAEFGAEPSVL